MQLHHDLGLQQHVLGVGQSQVGEDVAAADFDFIQFLFHTRSTKLSTTRFSPALSNWIVSLLPSTTVTLPLPNFWWNTRSPTEKADTVPVDLATSSPSMVSGPRRVPDRVSFSLPTGGERVVRPASPSC